MTATDAATVTSDNSKGNVMEERAKADEEIVANEDEREDKSEDMEIHLGTDFSYTHSSIGISVFSYALLHIGALAGLLLCLTGRVLTPTIIWSLLVLIIGIEGTYMGAHRYFSHKSYKAKTPLKILLLLMQLVSGQSSAYTWARDHRMHHRYSDTDGDPHNAKRGLFYSHIGWLMTRRHPICKELRKTIDMSDLKQDKLVMFQYKYFRSLYFTFGFLLPTSVPIYFFGETVTNAVLVTYFLRYVLGLHNTFLVNSVAHKYGMRPYDKNLQPTESWFTSLVSFGEGWHNYHHAFPWDYKTAETNLPFQMTTAVIEFFRSIGLAYDLKSVRPDMLYNRIKRSGDGTHQVDDLTGMMTAHGPVHRFNPTYSVKYPEPDTSRVIRLMK